MKPLVPFLSTLVLICLVAPASVSLAQDQVTIPRAEYEALKQQAESAKQLQAELDRTKAELTRLKPTSPESPKSATQKPEHPPDTSAKTVPAGATLAVAQPDPPRTRPTLVPLPAIDATSVFEVADIIEQFAQNPTAARQHYDKQKLTLRGVIAGFDKPALRRDFEIVFRTPAGQLVCRVAPPERYAAVFTTRSGTALTGRTERGAESELLKVGDVVSIEGTWQGLKDGLILFSRCKVAGLK